MLIKKKHVITIIIKYIAYTLYPVEGIFILFRNSAIGRVESPPANRSLL